MSIETTEDLIHQARPEVSQILAEHGRQGLLELQESIGMYREIVEPLLTANDQPASEDPTSQTGLPLKH